MLVPAIADMNTLSTLAAFSGRVTDATGKMLDRSIGTTTNDDALAGQLGEEIFVNVLAASAVALTTATPANLMSIILTPGDWEVSGQGCFTPTATTNWTEIRCGINTVSATLPTLGGAARLSAVQDTKAAGTISAVVRAYSLNNCRISVAANTTVYLVGQGTFSASTLAGFGWLHARRLR
jgi:hypothetical protein